MVLGNRVWAYQRLQNEPQPHPFPLIWGQNKKTRKSDFPHSNDKTLRQSCSDQLQLSATCVRLIVW